MSIDVQTPDAAMQVRVIYIPEPVVLHGVTYGEYLRLRRDETNDHLRMTYHDGTLELMSPEFIHELPSRRLSVLVFVVCEELDVEFLGAGSTTIHRGQRGSKKGKGKEPDECFYFANAQSVLGKQRIDLNTGDPPPDLWIEVDNRSSSRGKLPVYAELGVPEVWRYRARSKRLWFGRLAPGGQYEPIDRSISLPMLTPALVREGLALGDGLLEGSWIKKLRAWVREKFVIGPGEAKG